MYEWRTVDPVYLVRPLTLLWKPHREAEKTQAEKTQAEKVDCEMDRKLAEFSASNYAFTNTKCNHGPVISGGPQQIVLD